METELLGLFFLFPDGYGFDKLRNSKNGKSKPLFLKKASDFKIRRHMKIIANANPFEPVYKEYFAKREEDRKKRRLLSFNTELTGLKIIQPY